MRGKFIVFEGIDGSGKSTRAKIAFEYLKNLGVNVVFLTEPAKGFLGERIREIVTSLENPVSLLAQVFLFSANRAHFYETVIKPKLEEGIWIVMDRSWISTIAYQGYGEGYGDPALLDQIDLITKMATKGIDFDLCILCDISVEAALTRISNRGAKTDYFESKRIDFAKRMRQGYLESIKRYPNLKFFVLGTERNADGNVVIMEDEIKNILKLYLGGGLVLWKYCRIKGRMRF